MAKFCLSGSVYNVIMHANFGVDQSSGFGVAMGRILAFSIDLRNRYSGSSGYVLQSINCPETESK